MATRCNWCRRKFLHHPVCPVNPPIKRAWKTRTQDILRRSQAGGKFYGHHAVFAVYRSASARWRSVGKQGTPVTQRT